MLTLCSAGCIVYVLLEAIMAAVSALRDRMPLGIWQAEIEMAQAREAEQSSQEAEQRRQEAKEDEDREEEASDEAVIKARAMDDWKDEHPRGYGNSKLRPTA